MLGCGDIFGCGDMLGCGDMCGWDIGLATMCGEGGTCIMCGDGEIVRDGLCAGD